MWPVWGQYVNCIKTHMVSRTCHVLSGSYFMMAQSQFDVLPYIDSQWNEINKFYLSHGQGIFDNVASILCICM